MHPARIVSKMYKSKGQVIFKSFVMKSGSEVQNAAQMGETLICRKMLSCILDGWSWMLVCFVIKDPYLLSVISIALA